MSSTKVELVEILARRPQSAARDVIITKARRGDYHDFESRQDAPKLALVAALRASGDGDLAARAIEGEWGEDQPPCGCCSFCQAKTCASHARGARCEQRCTC
jgi:hypothetical protein